MFNRSRQHKFRYAVCAALALFIAQLGGIVHSYTHSPNASAITVKSHQGSNAHEFCSDCLNFAPLLGAGPNSVVAPISLEHASSVARSLEFTDYLAHRTYLAFRSRAPPVTR